MIGRIDLDLSMEDIRRSYLALHLLAETAGIHSSFCNKRCNNTPSEKEIYTHPVLSLEEFSPGGGGGL